MTDFNRHNESDVQAKKREVVRLATQMIEGSLGVIEGCTKLATISHDLEFLGSIDDFNIFVAVNSETDHLPIEPSVRTLWSGKALIRIDAEIAEYERAARSNVRKACEILILRFSE